MANGESKLLSERISREIIAGAIEVQRHLGPGLLESVYERVTRARAR